MQTLIPAGTAVQLWPADRTGPIAYTTREDLVCEDLGRDPLDGDGWALCLTTDGRGRPLRVTVRRELLRPLGAAPVVSLSAERQRRRTAAPPPRHLLLFLAQSWGPCWRPHAEEPLVFVRSDVRSGDAYSVTPSSCACQDWQMRQSKVRGQCKHQKRAAWCDRWSAALGLLVEAHGEEEAKALWGDLVRAHGVDGAVRLWVAMAGAEDLGREAGR